ncbi:MAG: xanthine dehydrogenase small subunit [Rhodobacteraceae bacterium]|nr:xanthine dehydrogenase small subunit [Paracoccaceae bacterium]
MIQFRVNGIPHRVATADPNLTLLDYLREHAGMRGTKEGCNEGDCGACTVVVSGSAGNHGPAHRATNACIQLVPQMHGKSVLTVEGASGPNGELHPVQEEMISHHGSQCGFCTPGIVMSLVCAHLNRDRDHDRALAGNLCRCTGYAPIVRAAESAALKPAPEWLSECGLDATSEAPAACGDRFLLPANVDELASWYALNPNATLVAGATDVGLWITKRLDDLERICFVGDVPELRCIGTSASEIVVGAAVTVEEFGSFARSIYPGMNSLIQRFGSLQVRNAATVGGNIANGSPIGDLPPAFIALGATLALRKGDRRRTMPLESFFVDYGVQDIAEGEFVEAVRLPRNGSDLRCYKISKRFDQDISAVCGCFNINVEGGVVVSARIAFGGMAATPRRARLVERALTGQPWSERLARSAGRRFSDDFTPISDMRASAAYRLQVARNLLVKTYLETGQAHGSCTLYPNGGAM